MTLKIERHADGHQMIICLSGRLQSQHLDKLKAQREGEWQRIALDLKDVPPVDVDAVRFLNAREGNGIKLLHCGPYTREWTLREQDKG